MGSQFNYWLLLLLLSVRPKAEKGTLNKNTLFFKRKLKRVASTKKHTYTHTHFYIQRQSPHKGIKSTGDPRPRKEKRLSSWLLDLLRELHLQGEGLHLN